MKTSNIIFITLLGTIAVLILAAVLDVRINGQKRGDFLSNYKVDRQTIPSFKVLCINNSRNTTLVQNDSAFIEVTYQKDSIAPVLKYTIKEDTLTVSDSERSVYHNFSIRINATDSLVRIILKNSNIRIERFVYGKLSMDLDRSYVLLNQDQNGKFSLQTFYITAKNYSNVRSNSFKVDTLNIVLHKSQVDLSGIVNKLSGYIADSSGIRILQPREISLKRDSSSNINVNHY